MLIADDEPLFIEMVEALLAGDDRIEVVGTAGNGLEAVELALALAPDVTLMDISMPIVDGIEAAAASASTTPARASSSSPARASPWTSTARGRPARPVS